MIAQDVIDRIRAIEENNKLLSEGEIEMLALEIIRNYGKSMFLDGEVLGLKTGNKMLQKALEEKGETS